MEKAANNLSKEIGLFVEELNRFISWVVLKRIHHNEHLPALYANTSFIERAIYVILTDGNVPMGRGPTQEEYARFVNDVRGGQRNFNLSILTQTGIVRYFKTNLPSTMLADARRCVSERLVKKIKLFVLAIYEQKKIASNFQERCGRVARGAENDFEGSIMGPKFAWHPAETVPQRPPSKSIWPYRESESDEKGRRKTESSRERTGGREQFTFCLRAMAQISQTLQAHRMRKEEIYKETQDAEERKQRLKNLRLHERLAKKAYNLWPQTKVTLKHLNFQFTNRQSP